MAQTLQRKQLRVTLSMEPEDLAWMRKLIDRQPNEEYVQAL